MYRFLTGLAFYQQPQQHVMLTSRFGNDVQTTIIHMGGNVIVTRGDSSYKWKIKPLKHVRCSLEALGLFPFMFLPETDRVDGSRVGETQSRSRQKYLGPRTFEEVRNKSNKWRNATMLPDELILYVLSPFDIRAAAQTPLRQLTANGSFSLAISFNERSHEKNSN